jgi:hypothetical protein
MTYIQFINSGSGRGFHQSMLNACLIKFGENPTKSKSYRRLSPTADLYDNKLLHFFASSAKNCYGHLSIRIFLRTLIARELGNYLLTGEKDINLVESIKDADLYFYAKGYGRNLIALNP